MRLINFGIIYIVLAAMSFIMLAVLVVRYSKWLSVHYVMMFVMALICNIGYAQLSASQTLGAAIQANQIVYLGASFAPFFVLMSVSHLTRIPFSKKIQTAFAAAGMTVFLMASSYPYQHWYYRSVDLMQQDGVSYLVKEYGPLHNLFPLYLFVVLIVGSTLIIRAFRKKKDISYITCALLMAVFGTMLVVYVTEKVLGLKNEYLPFAYVTCQAVILILVRRISRYDVIRISADNMAQDNEVGFAMFDTEGRYLGADTAAKLWFPELRELPVDRRTAFADTEFLRQIGACLRGEAESDAVQFEVGDRFVEVRHVVQPYRKTKPIHCFYLRDDTEQQQYLKLVRSYNENLERDVDAKTEQLRQIQDDIIVSMASIVENRDNNTGGHIQRTSDVVKIFVRHLQEAGICEELTPQVARRIIKAAPLHDFGKIAVPDVILNKPGKYTDEEYETMKQHSAKGAVIVERILQNSNDPLFLSIAVNVAHYHHEKWNGTGYPEGISGEQIPFEARVMALADVFDALVSKRVYKEKFSYDRAFSIIEESCGSHFDPTLCRAFLDCREELEQLYDSYTD